MKSPYLCKVCYRNIIEYDSPSDEEERKINEDATLENLSQFLLSYFSSKVDYGEDKFELLRLFQQFASSYPSSKGVINFYNKLKPNIDSKEHRKQLNGTALEYFTEKGNVDNVVDFAPIISEWLNMPSIVDEPAPVPSSTDDDGYDSDSSGFSLHEDEESIDKDLTERVRTKIVEILRGLSSLPAEGDKVRAFKAIKGLPNQSDTIKELIKSDALEGLAKKVEKLPPTPVVPPKPVSSVSLPGVDPAAPVGPDKPTTSPTTHRRPSGLAPAPMFIHQRVVN